MNKAHMTPDKCLASAQKHLIAAKKLLASEIRSYPAPIAGCDAQFNHLLEQRSKVTAALAALDKIKIGNTSNSHLNRRVG